MGNIRLNRNISLEPVEFNDFKQYTWIHLHITWYYLMKCGIELAPSLFSFCPLRDHTLFSGNWIIPPRLLRILCSFTYGRHSLFSSDLWVLSNV